MDRKSFEKLFADLQLIVRFADLSEAYNVPGYLMPIEGYALMQLAAHGTGEGAIVEIGSFKGRSTCWLAAGAKETGRGKVYAVDHFRGSSEHQPGQAFEDGSILDHGSTFPEFQQNIQRAGIDEYVVPVPKDSAEAAKEWQGPIRLLFIDASHEYEAVRQDFELWAPFLVREGLLCLHDVGQSDGVTRFHDELVERTGEYVCPLCVQSLAVLRKQD